MTALNTIKVSIARWIVLAMLLAAFSAASFAQVAIGVSVRIGPPALPIYAQPICPGPGYIWTPGYWAWNDVEGYYWVPGTWVMAPVGMLWTPGYWGWGGGVYLWHPGYWGPHVGFYGGINYGYGYTGVGFAGGEWRGRSFYYNRSVTNVNVVNVTNVYNRTVVVNKTVVNNVSYNGGTGGVVARPTAQEETYGRERHTAPLAVQTQHQQMAGQDRQNFASVNRGRPAIAATARPADFSGRSVVAARSAGGQYHAPTISPREARVNTPAPPANRTAAAPNRPASGRSSASNLERGNASRPNSNDGFRSFTPPAKNNAPAAKNTGRNDTSGANANRPSSNDRFRSFTPPAKNNAPAANNVAHDNPSSGNANRRSSNDGFRSSPPAAKNNAPSANNVVRDNPGTGNANRPNSNQGFRSFTPPANNHASDNRPSQNASRENRSQEHYNAPNNARPAPSREPQHQSAPRSNSGQEHRQGPPPKEERR